MQWLKPSVIILLMALMLGSCGQNPVKIGFVGPLTGHLADLGIAGRDGATLAVEEANSAGGIRWRKVALLVRDDRQDADEALKVDQGLIDEGVAVIIGHMTSAMSVAVLPVVNRSRVVMISPTTSNNEIAGIDDHFLRVYPPSGRMSRALARHAWKDLGLKSAAVVYDTSNRAHTESWLKCFRENFEGSGGRVVRSLPYDTRNAPDFLALARDVAAVKPDGLLILAGAADTAQICQQLRKLGSGARLLASEWSTTDELIEKGGKAVEGIRFFQTFDRNSRAQAWLDFRERYRRRFRRDPTFASVHAYDATCIALAALRDAPFPRRVKKESLLLKSFQGVQREHRFDRFGDPEGAPFLMTVAGGEFRKVELR